MMGKISYSLIVAWDTFCLNNGSSIVNHSNVNGLHCHVLQCLPRESLHVLPGPVSAPLGLVTGLHGGLPSHLLLTRAFGGGGGAFLCRRGGHAIGDSVGDTRALQYQRRLKKHKSLDR